MGINSSKVNAGGCEISCKLSKCKVGGCAQWRCGCYFGIASCKCDALTKANPNSASIRDFGGFARNAGMTGLMSLSKLLNSLTENTDYDSFFKSYQAQVESLSSKEREVLIAYLGGEY